MMGTVNDLPDVLLRTGDGTRTVKLGKGKNAAKNLEGQEVMERHDRPRPEGSRHKQEENSTFGSENHSLSPVTALVYSLTTYTRCCCCCSFRDMYIFT